MRTCERDGRRVELHRAASEVPASLDDVKGAKFTAEKLFCKEQSMSRARNPMTQENIPGEELPSILRQEAGREFAEEAAEEEQLTETLRQRRLDFAGVAEEAAHAGQRGTAEFDSKVHSGPIVATGSDYITLRLADQEADVYLPTAVWAFTDFEGEMPPPTRSGMSLKGRLGEHAAAASRVRVEVAGGSAIMGTIMTVADDHMRMEDADGRDVYVSIEMVRAVIRSTVAH